MKSRNIAHIFEVLMLILAGIAFVAGAAKVWVTRSVSITPVVKKVQYTNGSQIADQFLPANPIDFLTKSGTIVFALPMSHDMQDVGFTPDGKQIIVTGYGQAWMCNATTGENENEGAYEIKDNHAFPISTISPDGTRVLRMTNSDGTGLLEVFALDASKPLFVLRHTGRWATYSPDGRYLATADSAGPIVIREGITGKKIRILKSPYPTIGSLAFSANGKSLYLSDSEASGSAGFWDVVTGKRLITIDRNVGLPYYAASSPDGRWLCTLGNNAKSVLIRNAQTGVIEHELTGLDIYDATFSRDSRLFATTEVNPSTVRIWDTSTWKLLRTLHLGEYAHIYDAAFSPDGKRLVTSGNYITVWNIADLASGNPKQ